MLDKLRAVAGHYEELCARSEQPDFYADPKKAAAYLREKNDLQPIVETYHAYQAALQEMEDAQELMSDPEMKEFCQETFRSAKEKARSCTASFRSCCCPRIPTMKKM
jgi:peptide chain release factor 1